jgi:uncharacterized membrane protein YphA (DoxX/SURF4 family)
MPATLTSEEQRHALAFLIIRLASAACFLYHGSAILIGAFGGPGPSGYEYALTQLAIAVAILVAGAGPYSLYYLLRPADRAARTGVPTRRVPQA